MSITAWLTPHVVPRVIIESTVAAGKVYTLTGASQGETWVVQAGVMGSGPMLWADTRAPLGVETTYSLTFPDDVWSASVTRSTSAAGDVMSSLDGRTVAVVRRQDDDGASWDPRVAFFEPPDRLYPAWSASATVGSPSSQITARVTPDGSVVLRELVARQRPVLLLHNPSLPGHQAACDVELVRCVMIGGAAQARTGRVDVAERDWSLGVRDVARKVGRVPVATWGEARALGYTWGTGLSWFQVRWAVARGLTFDESGEVIVPDPTPTGVVFDSSVFDPAVFA